MMTPASSSASVVGRAIEFTQAPTNAKINALNSTGRVSVQSMLPRRWNITVPTIPVKVNVNSAVAIAVCIGSAANAVSAGMSRTPPIPTAPISVPTPKAIDNSQTRSGSEMCANMRPASADSARGGTRLRSRAPPALAQGSLLPADPLLELVELVFLHEHRVLLARIDAALDVVAVVR